MRASSFPSRIERLEMRRLLSMSLLKDINTTTGSSNAQPGFVMGSYQYFGAYDGANTDLWRTDGTVAGTSIVKTLASNFDGVVTSQFGTAGGLLYFESNPNGATIWRSDGTPTGTFQLIIGTLTNPVVNDNGIALFTTTTGVYCSDGTAKGTTLIAPASSGSIVQLGSEFYFLGTPTAGGSMALYQTDGTAGGTSIIRQFTDSNTNGTIQLLNGKLYFWASDATLNTGSEPWSSDGTAAGTVPLGDLDPGTGSSSPSSFAVFNNAVYFIAATDSTGTAESLFRTDGTANSVTLIAGIGNLNGGTNLNGQPGLVVFNSKLYFRGSTAAAGSELWSSDGTAGGTGMFVDLNPGTASSTPAAFQVFNGRLYFDATTAATGTEVFSTDGTVGGTSLLKDIYPGVRQGIDGLGFTAFDGRLFFSGLDLLHGAELWSTDGTPGGTALFDDIDSNTNDSNPSAFVAGPGGFYYFTANDGIDGIQLWKTDGTANGTSMLSTTLTSISSLTFVNGLLLFIASDTAGGTELWSSDGTTTGTMRVADIAPGSKSGLYTEPLVKVGQRVYFGATTNTTSGSSTYGLWTSDGTPAGTQVVIPPSPVFSVSEFSGIDYNGKLIFFSPTGAEGAGSVFMTDGTKAGTSLVESGFSEGSSGLAGNWAVLNGKAYFTEDTSAGINLWSTDGSTAGTSIVLNAQGVSIVEVTAPVITGGYIYFIGSIGNTTSLWRIDPSTQIATSVTTNLTPKLLAASASGGVIFSTPNQLLRFDGTKTIPLTSAGGDAPTQLLGSANGLDYFRSGNALWMTDGTAAGTVLVQSALQGNGASNPFSLSVINGTAYLSMTAPATGREIYELPPYARLNSDGSLTLEGTQSNDVLSLNSSGGTVSASLFGATLTFPQSSITHGVHVIGDGGTDTLNVNGGTFTLDDDLGNTAPNLNVTIAQGANVTFGSVEHLNSLTVSGSAALSSGGGNPFVTKSLTVQPTGSLDIADEAVIVDYASPDPLGSIQTQIARGYAGGAWNGPGITSSWAAARGDVLGFGESSKILGSNGGTFAGQTVDGTAILIRYTLPGDANLDGQVNSTDFATLAANYNKTGATFIQADFNYDGTVNALDFNTLATQYGTGIRSPLGSALPDSLVVSALSLPPQTKNLFADQPISEVNPLLE